MRQHRVDNGVLTPFCVLVIFLLLTLTASYKPVIVVHGLFDSPSDFGILLEFINETHPGTNVTVVDLFDRTESLKPLWMQVEGFRQAIYPIMQNAVDGVHLICYSQGTKKLVWEQNLERQMLSWLEKEYDKGGLICRALLSTMRDHNVDTFISLSSPQMGQYGDTKYLKWLFPEHMKSNLYRLCYTQWGQDFSICNYWNDPHHRDLYLNNSNFLALLNDEKLHPNATEWKENLLRIRKLVLIGGPDDGVIMPWQSSHFAFYDDNETVKEMEFQTVYLQDTFGLKTLDARGDLVFYTVPGVPHTYWHSNRTVYDKCISQWLT